LYSRTRIAKHQGEDLQSVFTDAERFSKRVAGAVIVAALIDALLDLRCRRPRARRDPR
jgi:hypothetical protein